MLNFKGTTKVYKGQERKFLFLNPSKKEDEAKSFQPFFSLWLLYSSSWSTLQNHLKTTETEKLKSHFPLIFLESLYSFYSKR